MTGIFGGRLFGLGRGIVFATRLSRLDGLRLSMASHIAATDKRWRVTIGSGLKISGQGEGPAAAFPRVGAP